MRYPCKLSTSEAKMQAEQIAREGSEMLSITGGEPTLRKDLFELISFAKSLEGIRVVDLQTNAMLCSLDGFAERLARAGLDSAFVSLHSRNAALSDKITQRQGSFEKTVRGIEKLRDEGVRVTINTVVNSLNYRDLEGFVEFVREKFPGAGINFSVAQPVGNAWTNPAIVPRYSEIKPFLLAAALRCRELEVWFSNPFCGVPPCFFTGFEENTLELEVFLGKKSVQEKKTVQNVVNEKVKGTQCKNCDFDSCCFGVWKNYAALYGTSELVPVQGFDFERLRKAFGQ